MINTKTNYNDGKIYKIEAINGEEGDIYIGSTTKLNLNDRMMIHKYYYDKYQHGEETYEVPSFQLFIKYGIENCRISLIEKYPCNTRDNLLAREASHILDKNCINTKFDGTFFKLQHELSKHNAKIPDRTREQYVEQYMRVNRENKITCECGSKYSRHTKSQHLKTKKHIEFINLLDV